MAKKTVIKDIVQDSIETSAKFLGTMLLFYTPIRHQALCMLEHSLLLRAQ